MNVWRESPSGRRNAENRQQIRREEKKEGKEEIHFLANHFGRDVVRGHDMHLLRQRW